MRRAAKSDSLATDRCPGRGWSVRALATTLAVLTIVLPVLGNPALGILLGLSTVALLWSPGRGCLITPIQAKQIGVGTATRPLSYRVTAFRAARSHPQYQSPLGQWLAVGIDVTNTGHREHIFRADSVELRICKRRYSVDDPLREVRINPRLTESCVLWYDVPLDFADIEHRAVLTARSGFASGLFCKLVAKRRARIVFRPAEHSDSVAWLARQESLSHLGQMAADSAVRD